MDMLARLFRSTPKNFNEITGGKSIPTSTVNATDADMQGWIPKGKHLEFAGFNVPGMVYFGVPEKYRCLQHGCEHDSGVYIDPALPVAKSEGPISDDPRGMPSYDHMSPQCRTNYLAWLSRGKCDRNSAISFPLLYFYGLERRYFLDQPDESEKSEIVEEVYRLCGIYGENRHFREEVGLFLDVMEQKAPGFHEGVRDDESDTEKMIDDVIGMFDLAPPLWELNADDSLKICRRALDYGFISSQLDGPWFDRLFKIKFDYRYPYGINVRMREEHFFMEYVAASGEFKTRVQVPNRNSSVFAYEILPKICNRIIKFGAEVGEKLIKHSNFVRQNPEQSNSYKAMKMLPYELWGDFKQHAQELEREYSGLLAWAREKSESGNRAIAADIARKIGARASNKEMCGSCYQKSLNILRMFGYGVAEEYYLRFRMPMPADPCVVYKLESDGQLQTKPSDAYVSALLEISVGAYIMNSMKRNPKESAGVLWNLTTQRWNLTEGECRGLKANLLCILTQPHDRGYLSRLRKLPKEEHRASLRQFLSSLAQCRGMDSAKAETAIDRVYGKLK